MTEVGDGNSVTMSATEDISFQDRPEGFVSSMLSPCSKTSVGSIVNDSMNSATDRNLEFDVGPSEKVSSLSNTLPGGAIPGHGDVTRLAERRKVSFGAEDSKKSPDSPQRELQFTNDCCMKNAVSSTRKAEIFEDLHALEISALKKAAVELSIGATPVVGTYTREEISMEAPSVTVSTPGIHVTEACTVVTHDMDVTVRANFDEEATHLGESVLPRNVVEDGLGGELESLTCTFKNESVDIASQSITVKELPPTRNEDAGHQLCDGIYVKQNGEILMDGAVSVMNRSISLHTVGATGGGNEVVNSVSGYTIGRNVLLTSEKFTEDSGDKSVAPMADKMSSKFADVVAGRMADAIADEIADQIADRIAHEMAGKMADEMADEMAGGIAHDMVDSRMADKMVDERAYRMAHEKADRMADKIADEMTDRMAVDEMAVDEMVAKMADEVADEVLNGDFVRSDGALENERMDGDSHEIADLEEQIAEDANKAMDDDDYEDDEGTPEEQMSFVEELEKLFKQRSLEYKAPKFYGLELNVLKLWRVVSRYGGYDHVTVSKLWRTVGEEFKPPKTCTTISWSFRGFYEKALLDYERFKSGVSAPDCSQGRVQIPSYLMNEQQTTSPATPSSEPRMGGLPGSGSGRARRDAAARAMQGWHSQRMGSGDSKEPISKDKGPGGKYAKKEKKLTNIGGNGLKRKGSNTVLERAVKAVQARGRPRLSEENLPSNSAVTGKRSMKQQDSGRRPMKVAKMDEPGGGFDPPIVDEGPRADWVKINIHKHLDCYEIYALVPGLAREEVRIQCEPGGRLVIAGMPEDPDNPWGVTPFRKVISLPSRIDAHQTSAVVTLYGQLYVRVPIAEAKSL